MPVESGAGLEAVAHRLDDARRHLGVGLLAGLALGVAVLERGRGSIRPAHPFGVRRIAHDIKEPLGRPHAGDGFSRCLHGQRDPGSHDDEGTGPGGCRHRFFRGVARRDDFLAGARFAGARLAGARFRAGAFFRAGVFLRGGVFFFAGPLAGAFRFAGALAGVMISTPRPKAKPVEPSASDTWLESRLMTLAPSAPLSPDLATTSPGLLLNRFSWSGFDETSIRKFSSFSVILRL